MRTKRTPHLPVIIGAVLLLLAGCGVSRAPDAELPAAETPVLETTAPEAAHVHEWRGGVCAICGEVCAHEWRDGVCAVCGEVCAHEWQDGVCAVCGTACPHERHDAQSLLCEVCGMKAAHRYLDGKCTRCGEAPLFLSTLGDYPEDMSAAAERHGKTEIFHYPAGSGEILPGAHGTATAEERKSRDLVVYTPADYDPEKQYDVLIIAPGAGHNARFWLEKANLLSGALGRIRGSELLDRLIEHGRSDPMIVAVVEYYLHVAPEDVAAVYKTDLRERILPFLAANYGTYASVDENGKLIAAPEHFGYIGASYGAMVGWQMIPDCTDLFSYWSLFSGAFRHDEELAARIVDGVNRNGPILWLYAGDGEMAPGWEAYRNRIVFLDESCGCLEMDKNLCFIAVENSSHGFQAWNLGLYNSLKVFFHCSAAPEGEPALPSAEEAGA